LAVVDAPRTRRNFARLDKVLEVPNLIDIQKKSFAWLVDTEKGGLRETIDDISPIEDYTGNLAVQFGEFTFDDPVASLEECREKDLTYARPLTVTVGFVNRETGEIREQSVFMGDFPWMTERGTFIINGTERVVVTQLVRSPGAYLMEPKDPEKQVFVANLMPPAARGSSSRSTRRAASTSASTASASCRSRCSCARWATRPTRRSSSSSTTRSTSATRSTPIPRSRGPRRAR
jgi:DNA-directed RNA polymerase subunit beta